MTIETGAKCRNGNKMPEHNVIGSWVNSPKVFSQLKWCFRLCSFLIFSYACLELYFKLNAATKCQRKLHIPHFNKHTHNNNSSDCNKLMHLKNHGSEEKKRERIKSISYFNCTKQIFTQTLMTLVNKRTEKNSDVNFPAKAHYQQHWMHSKCNCI